MFALDSHTVLFIYQIYKPIDNGNQMKPVARTIYKAQKNAYFDQCALGFLETLSKLLINKDKINHIQLSRQ